MVKLMNKCILRILVYNLVYITLVPYTGILAVFII